MQSPYADQLLYIILTIAIIYAVILTQSMMSTWCIVSLLYCASYSFFQTYRDLLCIDKYSAIIVVTFTVLPMLCWFHWDQYQYGVIMRSIVQNSVCTFMLVLWYVYVRKRWHDKDHTSKHYLHPRQHQRLTLNIIDLYCTKLIAYCYQPSIPGYGTRTPECVVTQKCVGNTWICWFHTLRLQLLVSHNKLMMI